MKLNKKTIVLRLSIERINKKGKQVNKVREIMCLAKIVSKVPENFTSAILDIARLFDVKKVEVNNETKNKKEEQIKEPVCKEQT